MSSLTARPDTRSGTTLHIGLDELGRLHAHALRGYPHEVVGLLGGDRGLGEVRQVVPLENEHADAPERRFRVDGRQLMRAERALEADGVEVLGYYHSHPDHPASWSDEDRDQALPDMSYVITSISAGPDGPPRVADTRSWRLREDRSGMDHETLVVAGPAPAPEP
jgi:proteasome lid subunit RPN8/RPN11